MAGCIPYWYIIGWISYSKIVLGGVFYFILFYFVNISSYSGAGLESDIHTDTERSFCSNILRPVAPMSRPEAHFAGLHKQQSSKTFVWEVSEQAEDPRYEGRVGGGGRTAEGLEDVNEFL